MNGNKRLVKGEKLLFGVCSGLADYLGISTTLVRIIWALLACCYGVGILAYIICAIVMPKE